MKKSFKSTICQVISLLLTLFDFLSPGWWLSTTLLTFLLPLSLHLLKLLGCRDLRLVNLLGSLCDGFDLAILENLALSILFADARVLHLRRSVDDALADGAHSRFRVIMASSRIPMSMTMALVMVLRV